jgi:hypothetical protein
MAWGTMARCGGVSPSTPTNACKEASYLETDPFGHPDLAFDDADVEGEHGGDNRR